MKKIMLIYGLSLSSLVFSQLGVNTQNPQTTFHIDGAKDNPATGTPSTTQQLNDFSVTSDAKVGIGTIAPTERIDVASGNVRIRDINSTVGTRGIYKTVVADETGTLKTIDFNPYPVFHARLNNNLKAAGETTLALKFLPLVTSPLYSYDSKTGVLTFNQPGNYLVALQAGFTDIPAGIQLTTGIKSVPDNKYIARGSHFTAVARNNNVGELMNYTTLLIVPSAGYRVRFIAISDRSFTVMATETGYTGTGSITNVTIQKL